jgi:hypothetical protein
MMIYIQDCSWEGVDIGQLSILRDFGKMAESQNKKLGHSKTLRIKEIPVGFRYKFENGIPDQRGRF